MIPAVLTPEQEAARDAYIQAHTAWVSVYREERRLCEAKDKAEAAFVKSMMRENNE